MHSSSEKPQGLQGILWNLSLFRKERQHTNPSKGDLNVTLHWPLWELRDLFNLWVLRREQAGAGLQPCILPGMLRVSSEISWPRQGCPGSRSSGSAGCYLTFFSELMLGDHRQELLPCTLIHLSHDNLLLLQKFIWSRGVCSFLLSCISLFVFGSDLILGVLAEWLAEQRAWPDKCSIEEAARGNKPGVGFYSHLFRAGLRRIHLAFLMIHPSYVYACGGKETWMEKYLTVCGLVFLDTKQLQ